MKKIFKKRSRQKGVALLFTLGILGLLTVLALSFAASAMLERKVAQYNAGTSSARIMANAGMNRAIAAMTLYKSECYENFDQLISHCTSAIDSVNCLTFDQLYRMNTMVEGTANFFDIEHYDKTSTNAMHWIYVDNNKTGAEKELIGRFAYLVTPAGGRLNPAACVESGKNEGDTRSVGTATYVPRVGKIPSEIYIGDLATSLPATYLTTNDVRNFSYIADGGQYNGTSWASYSALFSAFAMTTDIMKQIKWQWDWFAVGSDAVSIDEVYWNDSDNDKKKTASEIFHRFNLTRTDWDSMTIPKLKTAPATTYSADNGLAWFNSSALAVGTFASSAERTNQVAANLIDYCDTDSIPTSDVAAASWNSGVPTYTGNEKTPYINELSVKVDSSITIVNNGDTNSNGLDEYSCLYSVSVTLGGEIINIFSDDLSASNAEMYLRNASGGGNLMIKVYYTDLSGAAATPAELEITAPLTIAGPSGRYSTAASVAYTPTSPSFPLTLSGESATCPSIEITKIEIPAFDIYLTYNGANCDYSKVQTSTLTVTGASAAPLASRSSAGTSSSTIIKDWETDDPRQNLNSGDWTLREGANSIDSDNSVISASSSGDKESIAASGKMVSTAYIRNATMKSPWELGAIHRGAKWETINLRACKANSFAAGTYDEGDGVLLDEIKMTENTSSKGLVNIKSAKEIIVSNNDTENLAIFRCLVNGIPLNTDYANVDAINPSGTIISCTNPATVTKDTPLSNANTIARSMKTYMENNFCRNRGEIVNASDLCNGTTDAEKEATVGKFVTLTTLAPSSMFKIVVLAQTLKDAGGPSDGTSDINIVKGDLDENNSIGTSAITTPSEDIKKKMGFAWYSRFVNDYRYFTDTNFSSNDVILESRSCRKGRYEVGYDQITGEQKLVAIVQYDSTNKRWTILSYELVSE